MNREKLIQNIHIKLRGLNHGMGRWRLVRRGLEKMDMEELVELNQLLLSIDSYQLSLSKRARFGLPSHGYHFGR